jgi:hypothetical protein
MPRRSNAFQRLVKRIETALNPDSESVTESHELVDKITGQKREVDIVVVAKSGAHSLLVSIECRGGTKRARPVSVEWVEQMWGKHTSLPTNKLILVARAGFTATALQKAAWLGVECYALADAEALDWTPKVRCLDSVNLVHFVAPYVTGATLFLSQDADPQFDVADIDLQSPRLLQPDGSEIAISDLVQRWVDDPALTRVLEAKAFNDATTQFDFTRKLETGIAVVGRSGRRYVVLAINVMGKCRKMQKRVDLAHARYGESAVAHGTSEFSGHEVAIVLAESPSNEPVVSVSVARGPT